MQYQVKKNIAFYHRFKIDEYHLDFLFPTTINAIVLANCP